ncbi:hypothetical protein CSC04_4720 [Enterobacter roggenkampii]|nr:hypothetical protein [Enterobacter roggenkampii]PRW43995.1 hypothetical protein CSC04_4720 [Enterobacter roggenkampii]
MTPLIPNAGDMVIVLRGNACLWPCPTCCCHNLAAFHQKRCLLDAQSFAL